jgi:hypothetical protein
MNERDELQTAADELLRSSAYYRALAEKFELAAETLLGTRAPARQVTLPTGTPPAPNPPKTDAKVERTPGPQTFRNKKRTKNMPHIVEVMRENAGRALHAREVVDLMAERGHPVDTADPVNNVGTGLRRLARQKGLVVELGDRRFQWVGDESGNEAVGDDGDDGDDGTPPTKGPAGSGGPDESVTRRPWPAGR